MVEDYFKIRPDIYGDYAIFNKYDLLFIAGLPDKELAETLCKKLNGMQNQHEYELSMALSLMDTNKKLVKMINNIQQGIDKNIKEFEEYDDYNRNDPRPENRNVKHLSYNDMQKQVNNYVLGVLSHLKEYYSCPKCLNDEHFIMEVTYHEDKVYEKMHCHECGYHEIKERPVYRYDPKKYERKRLNYE